MAARRSRSVRVVKVEVGPCNKGWQPLATARRGARAAAPAARKARPTSTWHTCAQTVRLNKAHPQIEACGAEHSRQAGRARAGPMLVCTVVAGGVRIKGAACCTEVGSVAISRAMDLRRSPSNPCRTRHGTIGAGGARNGRSWVSRLQELREIGHGRLRDVLMVGSSFVKTPVERAGVQS